MLEAAARKKYPSSRHPNEDEITAAIFSPLHYISAKHTWPFLVKLLDEPKELLSFEPEHVYVSLWPSKKTEYHGINCQVEPDVLITAIDQNCESIQLILEIKWTNVYGYSSSQSTKDPDGNYDQLARQWHVYGGNNVWHLFLTPEVERHDIEECWKSFTTAYSKTMCTAWKQRFQHITWHTFKDLCKIWSTSQNCTIAQWAKQVNHALEFFGIRSFGGFQHLHTKNVSFFECSTALFWYFFEETKHAGSKKLLHTDEKTPLIFNTQGKNYETK